jgi:hypothetical protein
MSETNPASAEKTENAPLLQKGDRVYCVIGRNPETNTIIVAGPGVYQGDEVPPADIWLQGVINLNALGKANPKILLDNGKVIWGCECWWGPEAKVLEKLKGQATEEGDITELRKACAPTESSQLRSVQTTDEKGQPVELEIYADPRVGGALFALDRRFTSSFFQPGLPRLFQSPFGEHMLLLKAESKSIIIPGT